MKVLPTIKYRPHRGGLEEAMKEVVEVSSMSDLKVVIYKQWPFDYNVMEIQCTYYGYDERIDWDTWMILAKFDNKGNWFPIGYTNGDIDNLI
jgi:hypothetical protein